MIPLWQLALLCKLGKRAYQYWNTESQLGFEGRHWTEVAGTAMTIRLKESMPAGSFAVVHVLSLDRACLKAVDGFCDDNGHFFVEAHRDTTGYRFYIPFRALDYPRAGNYVGRLSVMRGGSGESFQRVGYAEFDVKLPAPGRWSAVEHMLPVLGLAMSVARSNDHLCPQKVRFIKDEVVADLKLTREQIEELRLAMKRRLNLSIEALVEWVEYRFPLREPVRLLELLSAVAKSDGDVSSEEMEVIRRVAAAQGTTRDKWPALAVALGLQVNDYWSVLGLGRGATMDEVKAAYRRMIKQYHPDSVAGFAQEWRDLATKKTMELTEAYKAILARFDQRN